MSGNSANIDEVKRKIRKLKKLEIKIRFGYAGMSDNSGHVPGKPDKAVLVWNDFFDLHESHPESHLQSYPRKARYSLSELASMNREEFKNIVNEFFFNVYYRYYRENGMVNIPMYDPDILEQMGLPFDAGYEELKKRFRELAKKYHPDTGGDSTRFIELMENYRRLVGHQ